jgi:Gti1/Pac2 family transcription factor
MNEILWPKAAMFSFMEKKRQASSDGPTGAKWSPSRILGNFLIYRELDKPFPSGEKRKAIKKSKPGATQPGEPYHKPPTSSDTLSKLVGSLIDSYEFKEGGLVKKTISVTVEGITYHLISYYTIEHIQQELFGQPSLVPALRDIGIRQQLISQRGFREPVQGVAWQGGHTYHPHAAYSQHGYQQDLLAGHPARPPMSSNFNPRIAASQIPLSNMPMSPHLNGIPPISTLISTPDMSRNTSPTDAPPQL